MSISFVGILRVGHLAMATEKLFSEEGIVEQKEAASRLLDNTQRIVFLAEEKKPTDDTGQVSGGINRDTEEGKR